MATTCRKCGGTGFIPSLARVDGGRCWSCKTERIQTPAEIADDEAFRQESGVGMTLEERKAFRAARRALR